MTTDAAPSACGSILERDLEMIAIAHGTWNKRQAKLTSINREIIVITQGLRSFAKILKNSRIQSLAIRSDNSTAVFDFGKCKASISFIKELKQVHQSIEKLGIQIQFSYLPGVKNEITDALNGLSRAGDCKLKVRIFQQTCLQMNKIPTIDLFSQHIKQSTTKIHVNNKRTRRSCNRCSQSSKDEGTSMDSSSYPSPSSNSEEDQRRADRSNDNSSIMARPDMVHRTSKRKCSIPYAWLEQRNSGTRNIVNQEEFETPASKDMLYSDGPKARKGRRFARKILRILNVSKGAIDMILYGQRYNTQRRYYYTMEKLKKWTQINHYTILDLLTIKQHIIITEVLVQLTSVNTSTSSALQFLNGLPSMLSLTFHLDLKNNHMLQFTRKAISAHMIVKPKYEDSQYVGKLFDYWKEKGPNRNLTNIELQTKLTSLFMTICSMRPAEIEGISLNHSMICEQTDKVDLRLQPKTKSRLHSHKLPKTRDRTLCPSATFFDWLKRIDNKNDRSIRDNKYGTLWWNEDITIPAKRGQISLRLKKLLDLMSIKQKLVYSFRHSAVKQLVVMGLDEMLLNTHTTCEKFKINK
ncbi:MAG: hypothetical protein EZS28_010741 [Streblomastix strix]|uniref:Tyr recombinase domain-containing protein n=1 Tax=Streblomastix strix TaxID=222440 RepID=A0A5J4WFT8_9EUKA|nr:MAG: hypothetical protein EZS28_010741 [Streblomastix strix]